MEATIKLSIVLGSLLKELSCGAGRPNWLIPNSYYEMRDAQHFRVVSSKELVPLD